jgi:hypothetical protein
MVKYTVYYTDEILGRQLSECFTTLELAEHFAAMKARDGLSNMNDEPTYCNFVITTIPYNTKTIKYILSSVFFEELSEHFHDIVKDFYDYENHPYTWGGNNHSLVELGVILDTIQQFCTDDDKIHKLIYHCYKTLGLPPETLIDMET